MNTERKLDVKVVLLIIAVTELLHSNTVFAEDNDLWVQGPWVEVHKESKSDSSVKSHWIVNTQVQVLDKNNDWCHVKSTTNEDGYVSCTLLGKEKITKAKDPMMYFWMEPSLSSWEAAGKHLEKNLSSDDRNAEYDDGKSKRYSVPEFDAMKNRMHENFTVTEQQVSRFTAWQSEYQSSLMEAAQEQPKKNIFQKLKELGVVKRPAPSLFVSSKDYFFLTSDLNPVLDAKIVFSGGGAKVTSIKPIESYGDNNTRAMGGFWDAGEIEIELAKPIYFHKVASNGLLEVSEEHHAKSEAPSITCGGVQIYQPHFETRLKDYPTVRDSIANFYLRAPIAQPSVKVFTTLRKMKVTAAGVVSLVDVLVYEMDLNQDSIPDIVSIQYKRIGGMGGLNTIWERYVNLKGEWIFVDSNYEEDCT